MDIFFRFDLGSRLLNYESRLGGVGVGCESRLFVPDQLYLGGAYRTAIVPMLMIQPCGRVVVLHLAILGGGFLVTFLGMP